MAANRPAITPSPAIAPSPARVPRTFSDLPPELRLQVWHLAIPDGAYIHLSRRPEREKRPQFSIARCSANPVPPMLHTNSEARSLALRHFKLLGVGTSRVYFNPKVDTLMLGFLLFRVLTSEVVWRDTAYLVLGENAREVHNYALFNDYPYQPLAYEPLCVSHWIRLKSIAVLDLREWTENLKSSGGVDWDVLRLILSPAYFRAESLVEVEEQEPRGSNALLASPEEVASRIRARWNQMSQWRRHVGRLQEDELVVKVMRFPFSEIEAARAMGEIRQACEAREAMLPGQCGIGTRPASRRKGRKFTWRKVWHFLRRPS